MARKRINITIDPKLHRDAALHARMARGTDFSGLVTRLLLDDLGEAYLKKRLGGNPRDVTALIDRVSSEEGRRLPFGPRSIKQSSATREAEEAKEVLNLARRAVKTGRAKSSRVARKAAGGFQPPVSVVRG